MTKTPQTTTAKIGVQLSCLQTAAFLACLAGSASVVSAHATLETREAAVGAPYKAVMKIGHGCDGSATVKLRVQVPEGVIAVKPMPKPGWSIDTVRGSYAGTYEYYRGAELKEGVKEVAWTGKLLDEHYDEFVFVAFLARNLTAGDKLYFPTYQDCEKGAHHWIEIPAPGQDGRALKSPAPALLLLAAAPKGVTPKTYKVGSLVIEAPWARATPGGVQIGGGYVRITNNGAEPDRLIGGSLAVAGTVEVHEMAMADGVMKMRALPDGLEIKPGQTVELKPGGHHLMFMQLREGLKAGQTVKGTLIFKNAGTVEVEYSVAPIGAKAGEHGHH